MSVRNARVDSRAAKGSFVPHDFRHAVAKLHVNGKIDVPASSIECVAKRVGL